MAARRTRDPEFEVELVSVEVGDPDARLRLAYRLLLKATGRARMPREIESARRIDEEERTKPE
ncbi:hypothetical protein GKO46_09255 [SAR202 cluster bacterium JH702]|uniref:Uncharacterized protein n=1 Tax=Candidatus Lucifugimonas marina TaxID=3038979 RepID=A0ABD4XRK5_9CHLR|nr:hypothetical protein [SAR202 cluster bacterium JH702]